MDLFFLSGIIGFIIYTLYIYSKYKNSGFEKLSGKRFLETALNKGSRGEYFTFRELNRIRGYHKFVVNAYIPTYDNKTTEIDLILIHETGIYVIESKNYKGWIFGNSYYQYWTQTFKSGQKYKFYNPIKQNYYHIKHLRKLLKNKYSSWFNSVIVFGNNCELKSINLNYENVLVTQLYRAAKDLNTYISDNKKILNHTRINEIYNFLKKYTLKTRKEKREHIGRIKY